MSLIYTASPVANVSALEKAAKYLVDNGMIGSFKSFPKRHIYVPLRSSDMFASLVDLYASQFRVQWCRFKSVVDSFNIPTGLQGLTYIARVLLSHWLIDVYVSNRKACYELPGVSFSDHFTHEEGVQSKVYDAFLVYLHASLRPTHIKGGLAGHAIYIPLMAENVDWTNSANPFNIEGFTLDSSLFCCILHVMKGIWNMTPVINGAVGGPCWLFDWHEDYEVCTWFPFEGNFTMNDVALAYIVGVGCTPNLGPRDVDDWQQFKGCVPAHPNPREFERSEARRFYGGYEVRTIETRSIDLNLKGAIDQSKKWKSVGAETSTGESSCQDDSGVAVTIPISQYRLTDWCYFARVIRCYEKDCRSIAHRMLLLA